MPKQSLHLSDIKNCVHAAIITIRPDEYESVEKCLRNAISDRTLSITGGKNSYEYANLRTEDGNSVSVVVTRCVLQGNLSAQAVASNIITDLDPEWLLLVGIAGGIPGDEFSLGDVILASALHDFSFGGAASDGSRSYETGGGAMHQEVDKILQTKVLGWHLEHLVDLAGFETRDDFIKHPPVVPPGRLIEDCVYGSPDFKAKVLDSINQQFPAGIRNGGIRVWQGPCANANLVLKDPELLKHWQESARQTVNVETELAGVYMAARHAGRQNYPVLAIRGLSDIVGLKRTFAWTKYACNSAAAFACALLRSGFIDFTKSLPGIKPNHLSSPQPPPAEWLLPLRYPHPLSAYARYPRVSLPHDMPFDAGMIWGLPRGAFIGLWGGRGGADLVSELRQIEGLLQDRMPSRFPHRDWLSIDLARFPVPKATLQSLLEQAEGTFNNGLPGVVLKAREVRARTLLDRLPDWCRTLREHVFPDQPLALIVDTTAEVANIPKVIDILANHGLPLEILVAAQERLDHRVSEEEIAEDGASDYRPGTAFLVWMRCLEAASTAPLPNALLAARQQWRTNPVGAEKIFSALDLVEDLDMLADIDVDQAMLQTVEAYLPGRISSLVFAYTRSRRAEARQLALSLAESPLTARERQTVWLRAWVAGVAQLQEGAAAEALSALRYGHVELHRDLVLAALDQVQQKPTDARCERLLDEVWKEITPDAELTDVYKYCRGESLVAGQALSKWGATRFVLALRAGASFDLIPADLANLELNHPDPWWLLTALSPTADLLEAIARLDSSCRAVFGLTSIQEREELAGDVFLRSTIEECRRGRPLY